MNPVRRKIAFALFCISSFFPPGASAQDFPQHPVTIVDGFAAGGGTDIVARLLAGKLAELWGKAVLVENRPGADATIAADYVAHAKPDGYTLLITSSNHTVIPPGLKLNYDPLTSFSPITLIGTKPLILLANPSVPANNLKELIALAKSKPGALNFAADGTGTPTYLDMALFMKEAGVVFTNVTYRGGGPALVSVLSNETQLYLATISASVPDINAGKLKPFAVTSNVRSPAIPKIPTIAEELNLPDFNVGAWNGFFAPAGTPPAIVNKIFHDVLTATKSADLSQKFNDQGIVLITSSPDDFRKFIAEDMANWTSLLKSLAVK